MPEVPASEKLRSEATDYVAVEPALKIAENRDASSSLDVNRIDEEVTEGDADDKPWDLAKLEYPILEAMVQPFPGQGDMARLPQDTEGEYAGGMPRVIHALPYRAVAPEKRDYPDTGLLPLELVPTKDLDRHQVQPGIPVQWVNPASLLGRLQTTSKEAAASQWATGAGQLVCQLGSTISKSPEEAIAILHQLQAINGEAVSLARQLGNKSSASRLLRTSHALQRRIDVWQRLLEPDSIAKPTTPHWGNPERLASVLAVIDDLAEDSPQGDAWRDYLLMDRLQGWLDNQSTASQHEPLPPELAGRVLDRLTRTSLTSSQRHFLSSEPMVALRRELRCWVAKPVDVSQLLKYIEQYERTRLASDAKLVARDCLDLDLSLDGNHRELARCIGEHYRNANVRVAVSEAFLNQLMPQRDPQYGKVNDTVLGIPVRGKSLTSTDLGIKLIPNPNRVRLALEVKGEVAALTRTSAGPATFYSDSQTMYAARKPMEIDLKGIHLSPSKVAVYSRTHLREVATEYDPYALLSPLAKRVARSKYDQNRDAAKQEIRRKVAAQAREQIDQEADGRVTEISRKMHERLVVPMETLGLEPTMIHAKTDKDQFIMRLRLAGEDQLGGTTPRPRVPAGSLASFQIHETAINNAIEHLELDGRTFTLNELSAHVSKQFHLEKPWKIETHYDNVAVTFAKRNAFALRCEGGRVMVTLSIARLHKPPRSWRNFQIRVFYKPQIQGNSAKLARDGHLQLLGKRMKIGTQIPIRGIFAKVFSKDRLIPLTPARLAHDERMRDFVISQFTITDGWIGIALGPKKSERPVEKTTERTAQLRRLRR